MATFTGSWREGDFQIVWSSDGMKRVGKKWKSSCGSVPLGETLNKEGAVFNSRNSLKVVM